MDKAKAKETILKSLPAIVLALELALVVIGTILFLAFGLDHYGTFVVMPLEVCTLPYALAFPLFISMEWLGYFVSKDPEYRFAKIFIGPSRLRIYTSLLITIIATAIALFAFYNYGDVDPDFAANMLGLMSVPGILSYCIVGFILNRNFNVKTPSFWIPIICVVSLIALFICGLVLSSTTNSAFAMLQAGSPLICVALIALGRDEWKNEAEEN